MDSTGCIMEAESLHGGIKPVVTMEEEEESLSPLHQLEQTHFSQHVLIAMKKHIWRKRAHR